MALGFTAIPAEAAPAPRVDYVALGDSYTAGTGAGALYRPPNTPCWQSHPGYVDVVDADSLVTLVANRACHGAVLSVNSPLYDNVIITPTVEQQLSDLTTSKLLTPQTELVSLTAGANDVGVSRVLGACILSTMEVCQGAIDLAVGALPAVGAALTQTYAAIHRAAPRAKIAVLGYPKLFDPSSPIQVMAPERQIKINEASTLLNATIATAAATANLLYRANTQYVDVSQRFAGHEANSINAPWLVLVLDPTLPPADANFHPNLEGHVQYAAALESAVSLPELARLP
jgi:lysophospholipase L1-like esterase